MTLTIPNNSRVRPATTLYIPIDVPNTPGIPAADCNQKFRNIDTYHANCHQIVINNTPPTFDLMASIPTFNIKEGTPNKLSTQQLLISGMTLLNNDAKVP